MLRLEGIDRSYGTHQVLHGVTFGAERGRLTGFVGGNGAGKTTAMRIIIGVLSADRGTVALDGEPLSARRRLRFGYMPEERGLYPKMPVLDQVAYLARLHGYTRAQATQRARGLLVDLGLEERLTDPLESLSLGNQQRVQIAAALVHGPDVLVLDEPFSGLDPNAVDVVLEVLAAHARAGAVVLFSSHQLDVVERLCDDVVIINAGRIVAAGETTALREERAGRQYVLAAPGDLTWVPGMPGVTLDDPADAAHHEDGSATQRVVFHADDPAAQAVLHEATRRGPVATFAHRLPTLAEIFKDVTAENTPAPTAAASAQEGTHR